MSSTNKNLIAATMVATGIFVSWAWTLPGYQAAVLLKGIAVEKEAELIEKQEILDKIESLYSQYKSQEEDVARLSKIIPVAKSLPETITTLEAVASQNGLSIVTFSTANQLGPSGASYDLVSFDIDLFGTYPAMVNLLASLEKNLRLIDINLVQVDVPTGNTGRLAVKLKTNMYVLKEVRKTTAAPSAEE